MFGVSYFFRAQNVINYDQRLLVCTTPTMICPRMFLSFLRFNKPALLFSPLQNLYPLANYAFTNGRESPNDDEEYVVVGGTIVIL